MMNELLRILHSFEGRGMIRHLVIVMVVVAVSLTDGFAFFDEPGTHHYLFTSKILLSESDVLSALA
jgi:hypothetical protein